MNARSANTEFRPWAVVPAKGFTHAKSRLDASIGPVARRRLARELLERVLAACRRSDALAGILVATDGDDVTQIARRAGALVVRDRPAGHGALSAVVDAALVAGSALGATHAIVLMADLPGIEPRDVRELVEQLGSARMLIAPDAQRRGTSALGLPLGLAFATHFGQPDSFHRHTREALRRGLALQLVSNPRIALDLDTTADLLRHRLTTPIFTARSRTNSTRTR